MTQRCLTDAAHSIATSTALRLLTSALRQSVRSSPAAADALRLGRHRRRRRRVDRPGRPERSVQPGSDPAPPHDSAGEDALLAGSTCLRPSRVTSRNSVEQTVWTKPARGADGRRPIRPSRPAVKRLCRMLRIRLGPFLAAAAGGTAAFADVAAAGRAHLGAAGQAQRSVRSATLLRLDQLGGAVRLVRLGGPR